MSTNRQPGFLRYIDDLNQWNPADFRKFYIDGKQAGYIKHFQCDLLAQWPGYFAITKDRVELLATADSVESRGQILAEVVNQLAEQSVIRQPIGESYPVIAQEGEEILATIDRVAAGFFGIKTFGQHLNGYVNSVDGLKLWIARRDASRVHFPNKLDNIVAGGLPSELSLKENLRKECHEEADIPAHMADKATPVGSVSYCRDNGIGLKQDKLYCYDLEVPEDFVPRNTDGEVAEFLLLPVDDVLQLILETDQFKLNCNLVFIDFFIRHGIINQDHPEYSELVSGLRK